MDPAQPRLTRSTQPSLLAVLRRPTPDWLSWFRWPNILRMLATTLLQKPFELILDIFPLSHISRSREVKPFPDIRNWLSCLKAHGKSPPSLQ